MTTWIISKRILVIGPLSGLVKEGPSLGGYFRVPNVHRGWKKGHMDQLIYHISIFQFPLSKADGEPKGGTETGLSLEQADHLLPIQTERAFQTQSDCQTLRVAEQGRKPRGERRTDVKPASLLVISLFVGSIPAVAVLCDFKMVRIRSKSRYRHSWHSFLSR